MTELLRLVFIPKKPQGAVSICVKPQKENTIRPPTELTMAPVLVGVCVCVYREDLSDLANN